MAASLGWMCLAALLGLGSHVNFYDFDSCYRALDKGCRPKLH